MVFFVSKSNKAKHNNNHFYWVVYFTSFKCHEYSRVPTKQRVQKTPSHGKLSKTQLSLKWENMTQNRTLAHLYSLINIDL